MKHIKYLFVALALAIFSPLMAGNNDFYTDSAGVCHITSAQGILDFKNLADVRVGVGNIYIMTERVVLDKDIDMSGISFSSITNFAGTFDGIVTLPTFLLVLLPFRHRATKGYANASPNCFAFNAHTHRLRRMVGRAVPCPPLIKRLWRLAAHHISVPL